MTIHRRIRSMFLALAFAPAAMAQETFSLSEPLNQQVQPSVANQAARPVSYNFLENPSTPQAPTDDEKKAKAVEALGESPLATVFDAIGPDARLYTQHNITLSNPFMEGRIPGSDGNRRAADYIEFWYRKYNLAPAFSSETGGKSFRQPFQHGSTVAVTTQNVTLHPTGREDMKLTPGKDFTVLSSSGSGNIKGQLVFCGYAVDGPDDYRAFPENADIAGMVALVMRFEPMDANGKSKWAERGWSPAASLDAKLERIAKLNPAAIILCNPPNCADPRSKELIPFSATDRDGQPLKIPVIMVTTELADRLVRFNGPLTDFRDRSDDQGMLMKITDTKASIDLKVDHQPVMTDNVGAVLQGRGSLQDEFIVVGAHYDHVGYGTLGADPSNRGKLHPGADDNASGTAGVLLLASKLSESYAKLPENTPARSILFLTFSAEESGLNGSIHYVDHPSVELSKIQFMLNMDMIGRLRSAPNDPRYKDYGLEVEGSRSAEGFYELVKPYFDASGIEIKHGDKIASNSDHWSFYSKNIPILNFFSGYHSDYHKPADTFDHINQVGAVKIVAMAHDICLNLAQHKDRLKFAPRKRTPVSSDPKPAGRPRFGIKPASYDENETGIEVEEVFEDTSAADAGIQAGDIMIKWNGKPLTNVETWMPLLQAANVGDVVEVTVKRDGKEKVIKVTLKAGESGSR